MSEPTGDLILTWPKSRPLSSYLDELVKARCNDQVINFRVANAPAIPFGAWRDRPGRCYMVHDGAIRGYNEIISIDLRDEGEIARVESDAFAGFWPAGWYIVRDPLWHPVTPIPMRGFQGFRYYREEQLCPTS